MVTSWNQFCFTGGIVEIKLRLPGSPARPGLWPAAWMMGNLARAGYVMSTDRVWPWSYKDCDLSLAQYQKFDPCGNHSHNISGDVADKYRGRGGPEFDILETNTCPTKGLAPVSDDRSSRVTVGCPAADSPLCDAYFAGGLRRDRKG
jgi:beta-glucanase (GH16 family)